MHAGTKGGEAKQELGVSTLGGIKLGHSLSARLGELTYTETE